MVVFIFNQSTPLLGADVLSLFPERRTNVYQNKINKNKKTPKITPFKI